MAAIFALLLLVILPLIQANTWIELGTCDKWNYQNVDDWELVRCAVPNVCETGSFQSPVKISSQRTVTDESLQALQFTGYQSGNVTVVYDGVSVYVPYHQQGTFSNPGDGQVFESHQFEFATHNEQLLFTGVNRLSLDIMHYQIKKTWDTFPVGTEAVAMLSMYFKIGNESRFLDPLFQGMSKFQFGKNLPKRPQQISVSWPGLADVFKTLETEQAHGYFNFQGSLTAPPCSETIEWHVFDFEWEISQKQFDILKNLVGGNQRPVQRQVAKVDFFDPYIGKPEPFFFSNLSNGSIGAIVLACIFLLVALLAIFFGLTSKNNPEAFATY